MHDRKHSRSGGGTAVLLDRADGHVAFGIGAYGEGLGAGFVAQSGVREASRAGGPTGWRTGAGQRAVLCPRLGSAGSRSRWSPGSGVKAAEDSGCHGGVQDDSA